MGGRWLDSVDGNSRPKKWFDRLGTDVERILGSLEADHGWAICAICSLVARTEEDGSDLDDRTCEEPNG